MIMQNTKRAKADKPRRTKRSTPQQALSALGNLRLTMEGLEGVPLTLSDATNIQTKINDLRTLADQFGRNGPAGEDVAGPRASVTALRRVAKVNEAISSLPNWILTGLAERDQDPMAFLSMLHEVSARTEKLKGSTS